MIRTTTIYGAAFGALLLALAGCGEGDDADTPGEAISEEKAEGTRPITTDPAADADPTPAGPPGGEAMSVNSPIVNANGDEIGTVSIEPVQREGVRVEIHAEGLTPGTHAVHFHETGRCDPPDFQTAGGHYNPTGAPHGQPGVQTDPAELPHHVGDMPNQEVNDQGTLDTVIVNYAATLAPGPTTLLDDDGSALVIHQGADDYRSQPAGNAGPRVACAVVTRERATGTP